MMASRTVTSPAGERIELFPDDEWLELTDANRRGLTQFAGSKPFVLAELWIGGKVTDQSGRASRALTDSIARRFPEADMNENRSGLLNLHGLWHDAINAPCFERDVNEKRTYSIRLVAMPEMWHRKMLAIIGNRTVRPAPTDEPEPIIPSEPVSEAIPAIEDTDESPLIILERIDNVLAFMMQEWSEAMSKLSARLEENTKLRNQIREAGESISALKFERDGLRQRLRATEHNLHVALKGEGNTFVNGEVQRRMDEFIRAVPTANKNRADQS